MNVKTAVADLLAGDGTLVALLPGGIYTGPQIVPGMAAPNPFDDNGFVRPSALVRLEATATDGPGGHFDRAYVLVYFYDTGGYTAIDAAVERAREVLHRRYLGNGAYEVRHTDDVLEQYDDAILAFMHRSRYEVARYRG